MATKDKDATPASAVADFTHQDAPAPEPAPEEEAPILSDDDRVPINERTVALGGGKTEKCPHCGVTKLKAAIPGHETPEEYCPGCGRGAAVEAV